MRNEKGFVYPVSLCMVVFFSMFLLIAIEQNMVEKRFYRQTETILVGEYYMLSALKELEEKLKNDESFSSGRIQYSRGEVLFQRKVLSGRIDEYTFTLKLETNEQWIAVTHYDKDEKKMVRWVEKN
ncbi:competence type IV pilus minor pilin ComGG [Bacillus sp. B15-48]|uniref:competence type IV pilus minor pilin ComGG n=1 Tax=Bacillus sp. B15-48 TaxID=1548601 RepID=UPI00193EF1C0|nr:competence type IV pilus minor pilin ComGG [Bacillus sp. B15-48]MBM4762273.1 hypothetical protein [Bacillus sp. B15-48]